MQETVLSWNLEDNHDFNKLWGQRGYQVEAKAGIKIAGRNINNIRYTDNTTLMAESKGELKNLVMKVKEESEKLA